MNVTRRLRRNAKAISPVLAVLMMIAVAIAGSLITYAWVTGYIGFTTEKAGQAIMIQSMAYNEEDEILFVYVQNVGEGTVELDPTSCIYINGALVTPTDISPDTVLEEKSTATIVVPYTVATGEKITAKVTTMLGAFAEKSTYPTATTGDGGYTPPEPEPDWPYLKQITIHASEVEGTGTHDSFPVLISLTTDSDLAAHALDNGNDIKFVAADGTTQLDHEIESFNGATGALAAWVRIPSLSATEDTTIYMYYGNDEATNQQNPTGVWNSNYQAVYHLSEDPSGAAPQILDSTTNNNDATTHGSMTTTDQVNGEINGALDLDGNNDYLEADNTASLNIGSNQITLSAWVRFTDTGSAQIIIAKPWDSSSHTNPYFAYSIHLLDSGSNVAHARMWIRTSSGATASAESGNINANTWHYIVGTYDGSNVRLYVDGTLSDTTSRTGNIATRTTPLRLGTNGGYTEHYDGTLDEARISNTARTTNWIQTEYNNINSPGTFYSITAEQAAP